MKIAVCVKEVPGANTTLRHDESTTRLTREGDQVLNPFDSHAIEAAVQFAESGDHGDVHVTAFSMAPASAERTLRKALALGLDDAILIADDQLTGTDVLGTARVLAAAIAKHGPFDLVLMGQQAADSDCWVLPGVLAELLEMPVITQASEVKLEASAATVTRQTEVGYEKLGVDTPAVISVSDAINTPRYPALKAIMGAKKKPLTVVSLGDLGFDPSTVGAAGAQSKVMSFSPPPAREGGIKITNEDGTAAAQLVDFLGKRHLV